MHWKTWTTSRRFTRRPCCRNDTEETPIRILGIDPGLRVTGFGVIDAASPGSALRYVVSGSIRSSERDGLPDRLKTLFEGVTAVIETHRPDAVAVELVFVNVNPQSTLLLGQARGAVIAAAVARGLPVSEYTALQIKQAVVGHGHARKEQVQAMVTHLLKLPQTPPPDPADALACAIRHAHAGLLPLANPLSGLKVRRGRLVM
ncbi:MAG: crossover junction endodeoxyribonuclease RuvC [Betaproteobacteria bacterium]|nr:crossover junction endodeoxyribonuclease RuvC [Betaproteobacteria bacterium]MDE2212396.1 crossover junction endodeoxyribonuclease RuvC [Betaproteobacteria bacterium]